MNLYRIEEQLVKHEGEKLTAYFCPAGKLTIGCGRNLEGKGISREESRFMLQNDIRECVDDLQGHIFPGQFDDFPENIQHVLTDMRFQLGHVGFRRFKKMIVAFQRLNLEEAVKQMKDSRWYHQVPARAGNLIKMVEGFI